MYWVEDRLCCFPESNKPLSDLPFEFEPVTVSYLVWVSEWGGEWLFEIQEDERELSAVAIAPSAREAGESRAEEGGGRVR